MRKIVTQLTLVYYSFFVLAILSALLGFWLFRNNYIIDYQSQTGIILQTFLYLLIIAPIPLVLSVFNKSCKKWAKLSDETLKISLYLKYATIRICVLGVGLLLGIFFYYVMNLQSLLFCAAIAAIALFFCKPSMLKIENELSNPDDEEKVEISKLDN